MKGALIALLAHLALFEAVAGTVFTDGFVRDLRVSEAVSRKEADAIEGKALAGGAEVSKWRKLSFLDPEIGLGELLGGRAKDGSSLLIEADVEFPSARQGAVAVYCDGDAKLFLDGRLLRSGKTEKRAKRVSDSVTTPPSARCDVEFKSGVNRILLRLDGAKANGCVSLRVATTPEQLERMAYWFQPKMLTEYSKDRKVLERELLDNVSYRYLIRPPFVKRNGEPKTLHTIMGPMFKEYYDRYSLYFDASEMPAPDFLELRTPLYSLYDFRSGERCGYIERALDKALAAGVPSVEVSLVNTIAQHPDTNPEVAPNVNEFYKKYFKGNPPELMLDSEGRPVEHGKWDPPEVNSSCYSYHDPRHREYVVKSAAEIARSLRERGDRRIAGLHVRFPATNDWYYPIKDGFYDYSPSAVAAFRDYLKSKYASVEALNAAYGSHYMSFDAIQAPKPKIGGMDISRSWQDWQAFRTWTIAELNRDIFKAIRAEDPGREIVAWMTTSLKSAARDAVVLDDAMLLEREFPNTLMTLTCFDFMGNGLPLSGELYGQLALAYKQPIAIEPLYNAPASYLKTFYNILRFPVKKANWLFFMHLNPAAAPWIVWVMNQRGVADELSDAKLLQQTTVNIFSYSDIRLQIPEKLSGDEFIKPQLALHKSFQAHGLNLPMITDYSLSVDLAAYKSVLLADAKLLRPEMVEKIGAFVRKGGTASLIGNCGEYDLNTGKADFPLLRELGVDAKDVRHEADGLRLLKTPVEGKGDSSGMAAIDEAEWRLGEGKVVFHGRSLATMLDKDGFFNKGALAWLEAHDLRPPLRAERDGLVSSFVKAKGKTRYIGFINMSGGAFSTEFDFEEAKGVEKMSGVGLISGRKIEFANGRFTMDFEIPWQVEVVKLELE